ncbi:hypothetical protein [Bdellovibrio svalbardensis]|uniref:Uncharacterized protein n=1 Tax=Bdellovibrio svalbardensis TaxID=2972972 RepID=A0ABT6DE11_9BACT|nr:hypothetical protein [Bdellovibrio svalbardensis]MDG0814727.1 hypothetical protein [Bdellovibrio svalbardensis]
MRLGILLTLMCSATTAMAASGMDLAKMNKNFACQAKVNQATMDMFVGMDPDGAAFAINPEGQTEVFDANRIVSRSNANGVETIVYKSKEPRMDGSGKMIFETVRKTVEIKRQDGKIMSVNKLFDMKKQVELAKKYNCPTCTMKMPVLKSLESTFVYDGDNCAVNQDIAYQAKDEKAAVEAKVNYDKKFCDALTPIVKQMGSQNAAQCGSLFAQAQMAYDGRAKELKAEGKSFSSFLGAESEKPNAMGNFDLGSKIAACTMADQAWGMGVYGGGIYGMGMMPGVGGMMIGGGVVMMGGGISPKSAPKEKENKAERSGAVR